MNLEELKAEWEKDCEIDDIELDSASLKDSQTTRKILRRINHQDITTQEV